MNRTAVLKSLSEVLNVFIFINANTRVKINIKYIGIYSFLHINLHTPNLFIKRKPCDLILHHSMVVQTGLYDTSGIKQCIKKTYF